MSRSFNYERAAAALTDALLMGDRAAAEKYEVSVKSIELWRSRLQKDHQLREFFYKRKSLQDKDWATEMPSAIASCIDFIKRASQNCDDKDPKALDSVSNALKIVSEIVITRDAIDARIRGENTEED